MGSKTTVVLVLILILVAAVYFLDSKKIESVREERIDERRLLPYTYEEVDSVEFHSTFGEEIRWRRDGDGWLVTYPVVAEGSRSTIEFILKTILPGRRQSSFDPGRRLADFGLENPSTYIITHNGIQSRSDTIYFGDKTPMNTKCYVRLGSSSDIILTNDLTRNLMQKSLYHLRNKIFLREDPDSIRTLGFQKGGQSYSFEKIDKDWFVSGTKLSADRRLIIPYLTQVTESLIYGFEAEDTLSPGTFGIYSPVRTVTLGTTSGTTKISFGFEKDRFVFAIKSGLNSIVKLESKLLGIFDWVDENAMVFKVFSFDPVLAAELDLQFGNEKMLLKRGGDGWSISADPDISVTVGQIDRLFGILGTLSFDSDISGLSGRPEGNDLIERGRYAVKDAEGEILDEVFYYTAPDGSGYSSSMRTQSIGSVNEHQFEQIRKYISALLESSR